MAHMSKNDVFFATYCDVYDDRFDSCILLVLFSTDTQCVCYRILSLNRIELKLCPEL